MEDKRVKFILSEGEMPTAWYNIVPDLPVRPAPPRNPRTLEPIVPEDLEPIFPASIIEQENTTQSYVDIPGPVLDVYRIYRPSPVYRARGLEAALGTPARIYYKHEGVSPVGSHKPNTAIAQAYYNKKDGVGRLSTETGAGQWGSALAIACAQFGLGCQVYMVRVSYEQKPHRRSLMAVYGADVVPSPSTRTQAGRDTLARDPESPGSLGIAISEAVEDAQSDPGTKYALGSVLNHVLMHQTVIGEEAILQMKAAGDSPDYIVACCGGGSNFGGLTFPFLRSALASSDPHAKRPKIIAVEPTACPTLTKGVYAYDFGDSAGMAPVVKMHTLGHGFVPAGIHAGGLRYHGVSPLVSILLDLGYIEARAVKQIPVFQAACLFARAEGILPAPESAHAIRLAIDLALRAKELGEDHCILFGLSGHGHFDLSAYESYAKGHLVDHEHPEADLERALEDLPKVGSGSHG